MGRRIKTLLICYTVTPADDVLLQDSESLDTISVTINWKDMVTKSILRNIHALGTTIIFDLGQGYMTCRRGEMNSKQVIRSSKTIYANVHLLYSSPLSPGGESNVPLLGGTQWNVSNIPASQEGNWALHLWYRHSTWQAIMLTMPEKQVDDVLPSGDYAQSHNFSAGA